MEEKRKSYRNRTCLGGEVTYNSRFSATECLVRNLSQTGARLVFSRPVALSDEFEIVIKAKGCRRSACVIWRREAEVGILFTQSAENRMLHSAA